MARGGRKVLGFVAAAALAGAAYAGWISAFESPAPVDLLPQGAAIVADARGLAGLAHDLSGTRFAAAFATSATRRWLERTDAVVAFDALLAEVGRISGATPGRGAAFDLVGASAAVGWYPPEAGATTTRWVAGGRLSLRAWAAASVARLGLRVGFGSSIVRRSEEAGRTIYSFPGNGGESLHLFFAGRVLVGGADRSLIAQAARTVADAGARLTREPAWLGIRASLPSKCSLYLWARDRSILSNTLPATLIGRGSLAAGLRAGTSVEIDVAAEPFSVPRAAPAGSAEVPGLALVRGEPLLLVAGRGAVPDLLADQLRARARAVAARFPAVAANAAQTGSGYAVAVTDSAGGSGLFPAPRGVALIGMSSAAEAGRALPLLFPPGARSAAAASTRALGTRESFPLAGEFELWGAAVGSQLVFATEPSLIDAAVAAGSDAGRHPSPAWSVDTVASISMDKAVPLLQRWRAPLSGLFAARWPDAPDLTADLGLLAAAGTVRCTAGSDGRLDRAAMTLAIHDLR